eukprot:CAMPEP_0185277804 /NCGR_PEP_ID=MMETSP1359-20130426/59490_1 /TAXON_ID=552665 /ORGANISM="Bigelowiella longifila, Strain CCMP242" /LENGTH=296 /DNA_ID=CAMNT_0027872053 /DNA_START=29 /DNA_END=919 /DNA_ORIENTATION=+
MIVLMLVPHHFCRGMSAHGRCSSATLCSRGAHPGRRSGRNAWQQQLWRSSFLNPRGILRGSYFKSCHEPLLFPRSERYPRSSSTEAGSEYLPYLPAKWRTGTKYRIFKVPYYRVGHTAVELFPTSLDYPADNCEEGQGRQAAQAPGITVGFYPENYTSPMRAVLSAVVSQQGVLVTPDPITESFRRRKSKQGMKDWEEITVISGELDEAQATAISELLNLDHRRIVTRQNRKGTDIIDSVFPTERQRYRMIPILGDGNNCCTFLEEIFPIACHLGIPGTAYDPSINITSARTPSKK